MRIRVAATFVGTSRGLASSGTATLSMFFDQGLGFCVEQRVNGVIANTDTEYMMTSTKIPSSQNVNWGFWGTMNEHAQAAWPIAMTAISDATNQPLESVQAFLDSRYGRHFADDVHNGLYAGVTLNAAIEQATQQWMGWTIGRQASKDYGIPRGMPYLIGFVIHCEIVEAALVE